jgi:hypothetical protein
MQKGPKFKAIKPDIILTNEESEMLITKEDSQSL